MTREERLELLKQIEKDIHVCSLASTLLEDAKSCAIHSVIEELEQESCGDCVSREALDRELYERFHEEGNTITIIPLGAVRNFIKELPTVKPATVWHMIKTRPLTDEEKEVYGKECEFIYDCKMPDDEQEVLIKTDWGIEKTTYYTNDGCFFEDYEDEDDVVAWTELPEWEE